MCDILIPTNEYRNPWFNDENRAKQVGENIKLARKRRKLTTIQVSERAAIDRTTLYQIEKGTPSVSMGAYFNVMRVLGLQDDFLKLASDDKQGRTIQDLDLLGGK